MSRRPFSLAAWPVALLAIGVFAGAARADKLAGHVKSVDADANTIVVKESGTDKEYTVTVNGRTKIATNEGHALEFKEIEPGDGVGILHDRSVASQVKVSIKRPGEGRGVSKLSGHVGSVDRDKKTIVVKESGTDKEYTVTVNGRTKIETNDGHALELKDLKPGDGVGILHRASVATAIEVSTKPGT